jgi:hypothetical protein
MIENENEDGIPVPPAEWDEVAARFPAIDPDHPVGITAESIAFMVTEAVTRHSMNSARTAQSLDNRLGASEIGMCRNYLRHVIIGTERQEDAKVPWAAFIGTALGDYVENAVHAEFGVEAQIPVIATLPESGLTIPGHIDLFEPGEILSDTSLGIGAIHDWGDPGWVGDLKAKDGVRLIRTIKDVDRGHLFQIRLYHLALVQDDQISPDAPAFLIYLDRSGKDPVPVVIEVPTGDDYIAEIEEWVNDVVYAVKTGEEASRDRDYSWCEVACPFFWACRGADEHHAAGALIEDEQQLSTIKAYQEGKAMEKEGKALAEEARDALIGVAGTTPDRLVLSWTSIGASTYTVNRQPGVRLNLRKIKG